MKPFLALVLIAVCSVAAFGHDIRPQAALARTRALARPADASNGISAAKLKEIQNATGPVLVSTTLTTNAVIETRGPTNSLEKAIWVEYHAEKIRKLGLNPKAAASIIDSLPTALDWSKQIPVSTNLVVTTNEVFAVRQGKTNFVLHTLRSGPRNSGTK